MVTMTEVDWEHELTKICGVKSVTLTEDPNCVGRGFVTARYNFWTYLIPWWLNRRVRRKVHALILDNKAISIEICVAKKRGTRSGKRRAP